LDLALAPVTPNRNYRRLQTVDDDMLDHDHQRDAYKNAVEHPPTSDLDIVLLLHFFVSLSICSGQIQSNSTLNPTLRVFGSDNRKNKRRSFPYLFKPVASTPTNHAARLQLHERQRVFLLALVCLALFGLRLQRERFCSDLDACVDTTYGGYSHAH
jgi:hypothetical protein